MYLAPIIDSVLESKKSSLLGQLTYFHITSILDRAFKKTEPFKFRFETYQDYSKDDFSVSGLYDMTTDIRYIILNFSNHKKTLTIKQDNWEIFKFHISQTCQHESIHRDQWQHRDTPADLETLDFRNTTGSIIDEKLYLADIDEIDAYGHDIAMEITYNYPKQNPYDILKTIDNRKKVWSYIHYKKAFKGEKWEYVKNRLLKKTFLWLPYVK